MYHPNEIGLVAPPHGFAQRLCAAFGEPLRVALVWHDASSLAESPRSEVQLALAGTRTRWDVPGHPSSATLQALLQDFDLALVLGALPEGAPRVLCLRGDEPVDAMRGACALVGETPPVRTPPGGIPFFYTDDVSGLAAHLEEVLIGERWQHPLVGVVAGATDADSVLPAVRRLEAFCSEVFVVSDPALAAGLPSKCPTIARSFPGAGFVGDLLSASASFPQTALLVASCRLGEDVSTANLSSLVEARSPLSDAAAFRGEQDSLPRNAAVLWEPKGLARLWGFLGAGLSCPQRILNQCRVHLLPQA